MKSPFLAGAVLLILLIIAESTPEPKPDLPRPLILQYPDNGAQSLDSAGIDAAADEEGNLKLWCTSWRVAAEANNLAPWRAVPDKCVGYVAGYVMGKAYLFDLEMVAREAAEYARGVEVGGDGMDAWVFDIDETLLSNLPYYAAHHFGSEIFNAHEFDKWVETAVAPPIISSLKLYEEVLSLGFNVFLLTGRSEAHRSITVDNLIRAGFRDWNRLILRGSNDRGKTATVYKSEKRKELLDEGYRLLGNSGDQWSDLLGSSTGSRSFKLPNPMYYIP